MYDENEQLPQVTRDNGSITLPADVLLVVPVRNIVMFPGAVTQVALTRDFSMRAAQEAVQHGYKLGIVLQKDPSVDTPGPDDLYKIGTTVTVVRYLKAPNGVHHLICQGEQRFRTLDYLTGLPFLAARFDLIPDQVTTDANVEARATLLKQKAIEAIELLPQVPPELAPALHNIESPSALADMVAGLIDIKPSEKQTILEALKVRDRLDRVIEFLTHRVEVLKLSRQIGEQTQGKLDERQREYVLRQQLKAIKEELGEDDDAGRSRRAATSDRGRQDARGGREAGAEAAAAPRGHARSSTEYTVVRTYLDWLVELPWSKSDAETIDIAKAREILDEDHYGLEKVKKRILEYLAVRKLKRRTRSPILCFVGPPGVGKTSLGQSIARALGRKFVRARFGGVHDEAEIRGHRRTYVGSLPGKIIQGLKKAGDEQPRVHARRGRQARPRLPRRPVGGAARGARSRAEQDVRGSLSRHAVRLAQGDVRRDGERLRPDPGTAARPHGDPRAAGLHAGREARHRDALPLARQLKANGLTEEQAAISEDALARRHRPLHARSRRAQSRAPDRRVAARRRGEGRRRRGRARGDRRRRRAAILGARHFDSEVKQRTSETGRRDGPRLDARRRRHPVHRSHARVRARAS